MSDYQVIPQTSIDRLIADPAGATAFDAVYGEGASSRVLGTSSVDPHQNVIDDKAPDRELSRVGKVWDNTVGSVIYGAQEGFNELVDTFEGLDDWYGTKMEELGIPAYLSFTDGEDGGFGIGFKHRSEIIEDGETVAFFGDPRVRDDGLEINAKNAPQHWTGQMVAGVSQFAIGYGAAKRVTGLTGYLGMFSNGALADALVFDPDNPNLTGFVEDLGVDTGTFGELMATDPDDPEWQNRLRNAVEGAALGAVVEVAAYAVRARKLSQAGRAAEAEEANKQAMKVSREIEKEIATAAKEVQADAMESVKVGEQLAKVQINTVDDAAARGLTEAELSEASKRVGRMKPLTPDEVEQVRLNTALLKGAAPQTYRRGTGFYTDASMQRAEDVLDKVAAHRAVRKEEWKTGNHSHKAIQAEAGAAIREFASMTGESVDEVITRMNNGVADFDDLAANIVTRVGILKETVRRTDAMAETIASGSFDPKQWAGIQSLDHLKIEYNRLKALEHVIARETAKSRSNVGRAMNAMKIVEGAGDVLEKAMRADPRLWGDIDAMAKAQVMAREAGEPVVKATERVGSAIREAADVINTYRINALLSGPGTQEVNFVSNLLNSVAIPSQEFLGGAITFNGKQMRHAVQTVRGYIASIPEAFEMALQVWDNKNGILDPFMGTLEDSLHTKLSETTVGSAIQLPTRLLMTMDELFKQAQYRGRVLADADEMAQLRGLKGDERATFIKGYLADSFDETGKGTREAALLQAQRSTFTEELDAGSFGERIQHIAMKYPLARFVAPFVRTPMNILSTAFQHVPAAGALSKRFQADIAAGGARRAQALGKQAIGTMLITWTLAEVSKGNITGAGPSDPRLRKVWLANNRPYSVKITEDDGSIRWISYARYEPMSQLLAITADYSEIMNNEYEENDSRGPEGVAWAIMMATMENSVNKTFTQGIYDFMTILNDRDENAKARALNNMIGSFVPNVVNQMNGDEAYREARTMMDAIWVRGPNYDRVDVKRNVLGEVLYRPLAKTDPLSVTTVDRMQVDPVMKEVTRIAIKAQSIAGNPNKKMGTIDLTEIEYAEGQSLYDKWLEKTGETKINGKTLRETLSADFKTRAYLQLPDGAEGLTRGTKVEWVSRRITDFRQKALSEIPELVEIKEGNMLLLQQMHQQNREQLLAPKTKEAVERGLFKQSPDKTRPLSLEDLINN